MGGLDVAGAHGEHTDAAGDFLGRVVTGVEEFLQALPQGSEELGEHAGLQVVEQSIHRQEGAELVGTEPQARQLPEDAVLGLFLQPVGLLLLVVEDRGVEA